MDEEKVAHALEAQENEGTKHESNQLEYMFFFFFLYY